LKNGEIYTFFAIIDGIDFEGQIEATF